MKLDVLAVLTLSLSAISFVFSILSWRRGKNVSIYATSTQTLAQLERSLAEVPTALRFHGITLEQLEEVGITPEEFAYLAANFSAGHIFHTGVDPNDKGFLVRDGYRYTMLKSPATRKAWPVLKRMIAPGKYRDKIEATIKAIEAEEAQVQGKITQLQEETEPGPKQLERCA